MTPNWATARGDAGAPITGGCCSADVTRSDTGPV